MQNNQEKIISFRKQANYYTTKAKRFKILIESVTGCYGSCLGCAFTESDRMQLKPLIPKEKLHAMFARLQELLDYTKPESIIDKYDTTVINFGGSEHFVYDNDYLGHLFNETSHFFNSVQTKRNVLAFSSSGLLNIDKMEKRSMDMVKSLDRDQFVVDMVIDLNRFDQLKERYQNSFNFFQEKFGFLDIAVNIESFSDTKDWKAFCNFIDQNGILNIDLVYAVNKNNLHRVPIESHKIFEIYKNVIDNTKQGKSLFDLHNQLRIKDKSYYENTEKTDFNMICKETAKNILNDAIFVDHNFNVFPVLFVLFADVPLNERVNNKPIGNLFDVDFKEKYQKYYAELYKKLLKISISSPQCADCPIMKSCYQTGAPLLNPMLNEFKGKKVESFDDCQNPVKHFILARDNNHYLLKEDEIE